MLGSVLLELTDISFSITLPVLDFAGFYIVVSAFFIFIFYNLIRIITAFLTG